MTRYFLLFGMIASLVASVVSASSTITECDRLASDPYDREKVTEGVWWGLMEADEAVASCKSALESYPQSSRLRYQYARSLLKQGKFDLAISMLKELSTKDNYRAAIYSLAKVYYEGNGVEKDYKEATHLFARISNDPEAADAIGTIYREGGYGIEKDEEKAIKWYRKAAAKNYQLGELNLGLLYFNRVSDDPNRSKDREEARFYLGKAAGNDEQDYDLTSQAQLFLIRLSKLEQDATPASRPKTEPRQVTTISPEVVESTNKRPSRTSSSQFDKNNPGFFDHPVIKAGAIVLGIGAVVEMSKTPEQRKADWDNYVREKRRREQYCLGRLAFEDYNLCMDRFLP